MGHANLANLLERATPYERWRAPLDPRLRWGATLSGPVFLSTVITCSVVLGRWLPGLADTGHLGPLSLEVLQGMVLTLVGMDLVGLLAYGPLLLMTEGFQEGAADWQWIAFAEAMLCAFHGLVALLAAAIGLVVGLFWLLVSATVVLVAFLAFCAWAAHRSR